MADDTPETIEPIANASLGTADALSSPTDVDGSDTLPSPVTKPEGDSDLSDGSGAGTGAGLAGAADPSGGKPSVAGTGQGGGGGTPSQPTPKLRQLSFWLVLLGCVIFLGNMIVAWYVAVDSNNFIMMGTLASSRTEMGNRSVAATTYFDRSVKAVPSINAADRNTILYLKSIAEAEVHLKNISNRQTAVSVAMAAAFSMLALGLALFVMGIESAYSFSVESTERGKLVLHSSAPGLMCLVTATIVILIALFQRPEVEFGDFSPYPDDGVDDLAMPAVRPPGETGKLMQKILGEAEAVKAPEEPAPATTVNPAPQATDGGRTS